MTLAYPSTTCSNINECDKRASIVAAYGHGSVVDSDSAFLCNCHDGYELNGAYPRPSSVNMDYLADFGSGTCIKDKGGFSQNNDYAYTCSFDVGFEQAGVHQNISCVDIDKSD